VKRNITRGGRRQRGIAARSANATLRAVFWATGAALALGGAGWLGLRISPRGRRATAEATRDLGTVAPPRDLPAPIRKHIEVTCGDRPPRIATAAAWGTARMRVGPVWLPLRFRTYFVAGRHFARHMEVTWFGMPVFRGLDTYLNGEGAMTIGNTKIRGPEIDQAANLALWAEATLLPTALVADPRARWEPVDDMTARLIVPFGVGSDRLLFRVDPRSGLVREVAGDRYRGPGKPKEPWKGECSDYKVFHDVAIPTRLAATWERDGRPWSYWTIQGIEYNVDVIGELPMPAEDVEALKMAAL